MRGMWYNTGVKLIVDRGATGIAHGLATTFRGGSYMPDHTTPHPYSRKKIPAPFRARYGRWTVLRDAEVGKKWICLCDCGNIRAVDAY